MKAKFLQEYHFLLGENRLEEFEQQLSSYFTLYFAKLLHLQHSYLDWLVIQLRPRRRQSCLQSALKSDYIKSEIKSYSRKFVMLIQFLNYAQHLDFEIKYIDQISYRVSNQRITKIKKNFIELVQILQEYDLIESNYKIISNGSFLDTNELNISNISEGFVIYEKIYI